MQPGINNMRAWCMHSIVADFCPASMDQVSTRALHLWIRWAKPNFETYMLSKLLSTSEFWRWTSGFDVELQSLDAELLNIGIYVSNLWFLTSTSGFGVELLILNKSLILDVYSWSPMSTSGIWRRTSGFDVELQSLNVELLKHSCIISPCI